jgi:hypothetical protein
LCAEEKIEELVYGYFSYEKNLHPEHEKRLDQFYQSVGAVRIVNKDYRLKTSIGHLAKGKNNSMELTYYAPDKELVRDSKSFCLPPFYYIPSCNYMFYGFYLTVCAYLLRAGSNTKLTLYLPALDNDKVSFIYRPEIAEAFLVRRIQSIRAIENGSKVTHHQNELFL